MTRCRRCRFAALVGYRVGGVRRLSTKKIVAIRSLRPATPNVPTSVGVGRKEMFLSGEGNYFMLDQLAIHPSSQVSLTVVFPVRSLRHVATLPGA